MNLQKAKSQLFWHEESERLLILYEKAKAAGHSRQMSLLLAQYKLACRRFVAEATAGIGR